MTIDLSCIYRNPGFVKSYRVLGSVIAFVNKGQTTIRQANFRRVFEQPALEYSSASSEYNLTLLIMIYLKLRYEGNENE